MANLVHIDSLEVGDVFELKTCNHEFTITKKGFVGGNDLQPESRINRHFKYIEASSCEDPILYMEFPTSNTFGSQALAENQSKFMVIKLK